MILNNAMNFGIYFILAANDNYLLGKLICSPSRLTRTFFKGIPGNKSSGDGVGPVAQRIRARGYEPRCRGFESLLAHNRPKREGLSL